MKIILDAMGGDNAPQAPVEGAVLAAERYGCDIFLTGDEARLSALLQGRGAGHITWRTIPPRCSAGRRTAPWAWA